MFNKIRLPGSVELQDNCFFLSVDVCYIGILHNNDVHFNLKANLVTYSEYMQSYIMHALS